MKKAAPKKKADSSDDSDSGSGSSSDSSDDDKPVAKPQTKGKSAKKKDDSSSDSSESDGKEGADDSGDKAQPKEETKAADGEHAGKTELFVQGLSYNTTEQSLRAFFEPYGELTKCKLMSGKAFVEYTDHLSAVKAIANTNEQDLDGR